MHLVVAIIYFGNGNSQSLELEVSSDRRASSVLWVSIFFSFQQTRNNVLSSWLLLLFYFFLFMDKKSFLPWHHHTTIFSHMNGAHFPLVSRNFHKEFYHVQSRLGNHHEIFIISTDNILISQFYQFSHFSSMKSVLIWKLSR